MSVDTMKKVAVIGFDEDHCPNAGQREAAQRAGWLLAERGFAVMVGGGRGIMKAAVDGANGAGGTTISFAAWEEDRSGSKLCLPTGMGWGGHSLSLIRAADGVLAVGGGAGTLLELCLAYLHRKPTVILANAGGWSQRLAAMEMEYLDERRWQSLIYSDDVEDAVHQLCRILG